MNCHQCTQYENLYSFVVPSNQKIVYIYSLKIFNGQLPQCILKFKKFDARFCIYYGSKDIRLIYFIGYLGLS